jgi:hypothetical protein
VKLVPVWLFALCLAVPVWGQSDTTRLVPKDTLATDPSDTLTLPPPKGVPKDVPKDEAAAEGEGADFPLDKFYAEIKPWGARKIFKNVRFSFSTGYGNTFFSHELPGYGIYQATGGAPEIFPGTSTSTRYSNWVNERVVSTSATDPGAVVIPAGTADLGFTGNGMVIPFKLTIHYEFLKRYRVGLGYSYEYLSMGNFTSNTNGDQLTTMAPSNPSGFTSRFFGMAGVSFYRWNNYLFTGDLQIGSFKPGNFDQSLAMPGIYVNGGVTIERDLSEYLRLFVRPSYEFKSFELTLPEGGNPINHGMNALFLNIGITYRIPELPKCFSKDCRIQMNHAHGNREYRSRVHPFYKKQNPQYGENHPNLIKYKGKNKKKLNPY